MTQLSKKLKQLMQDDAVPMSDAWGKLYDRLLAVEVQEPVAVIDKDGNPMTRSECNDDRIFAICCKVGTPLYSAPQPAPVAQPVQVPDEVMPGGLVYSSALPKFESNDSDKVVGYTCFISGDTRIVESQEQAYADGRAVVNACRAAMLKAEPVSQPYKLPAGWVAVPVEPTMEMLDEFDSIIDYGAEDSKDAWSRMLAAAPQEPTK